MDGAIAHLQPGQLRELGGLVEKVAVRVEDSHLLERDDVSVERPDERADPCETSPIHVPPPGRGEGLPGADGGADVPARDPDGRRGAGHPAIT